MEPPKLEDLQREFGEELGKLHMLIHDVGMSGKEPDEMVQALTLLDAIRMTNKKLAELKEK